MKRWPGRMAVLLFVAAIVMAQTVARSPTKSSGHDPFVGAWRLAMLEEPDANDNIHKADCTGLLVFTRDGHISVQVMYRNPETGGQAGPVRYAQGGYEASFGRYVINDPQTFTFHVEGAMVRTLIGQDLPRSYRFSGNQLIVKSTNPNEHWQVTWERH